jgi:hypothetical protein
VLIVRFVVSPVWFLHAAVFSAEPGHDRRLWSHICRNTIHSDSRDNHNRDTRRTRQTLMSNCKNFRNRQEQKQRIKAGLSWINAVLSS